MAMNRRSFITTLSAAAALPASSSAQPVVSLKAVAAKRGILIGTAMRASHLGDQNAIAAILHHCDMITPESALKENHVSEHGLKEARQLYDFAFGHDLSMHGHPLHFARKTESARRNLGDRKAEFRERASELISAFPKITSWDVLNEVIEDRAFHKSGQPPLRDHHLAPEDRYAFLKFSLAETRDLVGEDATLVLNDNNLSCGWSMCSDKRQDVLHTVGMLKSDGLAPDAVGLQSHLYSKDRVEFLERGVAGSGAGQFAKVATFVRALGDLGCEVHISELDVMNQNFEGSQKVQDNAHAEFVKAYLKALLAEPSVRRLTFWGLGDAGHNYTRPKFWPQTCENQACKRPALFDSNWQSKPVFDAVVEALES